MIICLNKPYFRKRQKYKFDESPGISAKELFIKPLNENLSPFKNVLFLVMTAILDKVWTFQNNLRWGPEFRKANPAKFGSYWSSGF